MNYFELFDLEVGFQVDLTRLSSTYKTLQQLTHPDRFATASERDKRMSVQKNAQVNDAYQVLKSPLSRAEYMLELRGVELRHEQQTMQDPEFLMQQMEWREQLEDLDTMDNPQEQLEELDDDIHTHIRAQLSVLENVLNDDSEQANKAASDEVRKLKFLYKLRNEIALIEDRLSDV